jgi:hypothetical protein
MRQKDDTHGSRAGVYLDHVFERSKWREAASGMIIDRALELTDIDTIDIADNKEN